MPSNGLVKQLETAESGTRVPTKELVEALGWTADGLIAVVVQDEGNHDLLMVAWMNKQALETTLASGQMHYWSRSRQAIWRKGESSGQTQQLVRLRTDCDADALVAEVKQTGVACHTGRHSCFYIEIGATESTVLCNPEIAPAELYSSKP